MRAVCYVLISALSTSSLAQELLMIPDSMISSEKVNQIDLKPYALYLEDSSNTITIDKFQDNNFNERFKSLPRGFRYKGDHTYWLKLRLSTSQAKQHDFMLNLGSWNKKITLYDMVYDPPLAQVSGGLIRPKEKTFISDYVFGFLPFTLPPKLEKTIYIKVELGGTTDQYHPVLTIHNAQPILADWQGLGSRSYFFLAVFASMIFYNFFLYLMTRESLYLHYILYGFFIGEFVLSFYFLPYVLSSYDATLITLISLNLSCYFFLRFAIKFLEVREKYKIGYKVLMGLSWLFIVFAIPFLYQLILGIELQPARLQDPSIVLTIVLSLVILWVIISLVSKGDVSAKYFLLANSIWLIVMITAGPIYLSGTKGYSSFYEVRYVTFLLAGIGGTSQIVLFGLLIGYRFLNLQKEKARAVEENLETQRSVNLQLEKKVTERTSQLEHRNQENELLLGEIHHRVKNNLQVISSLLKLQSRQLDDGKAKNAVLEGRDRVKAMALIHQRLYQQDQFSAIQMDDYVQNLVENLAQSYGYGKLDFQLNMDVDKLCLDVDTAIPLGLIINELVSNCFKHAFDKSEKNSLSITLGHEVNKLYLKVHDNGPGMKLKKAEPTSFGIQLIEALVEELKGEVRYHSDQGTMVEIEIKEYQMREETAVN